MKMTVRRTDEEREASLQNLCPYSLTNLRLITRQKDEEYITYLEYSPDNSATNKKFYIAKQPEGLGKWMWEDVTYKKYFLKLAEKLQVSEEELMAWISAANSSDHYRKSREGYMFTAVAEFRDGRAILVCRKVNDYDKLVAKGLLKKYFIIEEGNHYLNQKISAEIDSRNLELTVDEVLDMERKTLIRTFDKRFANFVTKHREVDE